MNFENRPTHSLRPYPGNARTHSPKQIKQISRSIERFGFNNPVLVDDDDQIIAGHGRVEAAKLLNMKTVPTVRLSHLSEVEKKAYRGGDPPFKGRRSLWSAGPARPRRIARSEIPDFMTGSSETTANWTVAPATQCRSNPVSGSSLPKTGVFRISAGDYRLFGSENVENWSLETGA